MRDKIRVNAVLPGLVETEMAQKFRASLSQEQWAGYLAAYPMGIGAPEDVANSVRSCCPTRRAGSPETGLVIDGGVTAS